MTAHQRTFTAQLAMRERVPLLIGLAGASSSGKTKSALRIADGIRAVSGGEVYGIDTEARRMAHYAAEHKFQHVEFPAPFGSLDYLAAIRFCVEKGASVVIVDSMSHEHEGPGGLIDFQEQELDRIAGNDWAKRERVKMLSWQKPKSARRQLINGLLQLNAHFIFCFRAREKTKPIKTNGKTEIVEMGFMPIAGEEFLFEMTANCLLLPKSGGIPTWESEHIGERGIMKLPSYLRDAFTAGKPLDENTGRALAEWARGGNAPRPAKGETSDAADLPPAAVAEGSGRTAGGEIIPEWDDYVDRWTVIMDEAASAKQLGELWNSDFHKMLRRQIAWPTDLAPDPLDELKAKVAAKLKSMANG